MPYEHGRLAHITMARLALSAAAVSADTQLRRAERIEKGLHEIVRKAALQPACYSTLDLAHDINGLIA